MQEWSLWSRNCTFYDIWKYNLPIWAYPLRDSYNILRVCGRLHVGLLVSYFQFGHIHSTVAEVMGFSHWVHYPRNFKGKATRRWIWPESVRMRITFVRGSVGHFHWNNLRDICSGHFPFHLGQWFSLAVWKEKHGYVIYQCEIEYLASWDVISRG